MFIITGSWSTGEPDDLRRAGLDCLRTGSPSALAKARASPAGALLDGL